MKLVTIVLIVIIIVLSGIILHILTNRPNRTSNPPPSSTPSITPSRAPAPPFPSVSSCCDATATSRKQGSAVLVPSWMFMAQQSVDGQCNGVDLSGTLYEGGVKTKRSNFLGVTPPQYKCRPAAGMPGGTKLVGGSWEGFCKSLIADGSAQEVTGSFSSNEVLLIEENAVVVLKAPVSVGGLVVRRNGTCYLMASPGCCIAIGFGLCESGGLLQAGSSEGTDATCSPYRVALNPPLRINLLSIPEGYWHTGVPCSQYDVRVLNPGSQETDECYSSNSEVVGSMCLSNTTTPKSLAVCFNGTLHLAGWIPWPAKYSLWSAQTNTGVVLSHPSLASSVQADMLAQLHYTPQSTYPGTFCQIKEIASDRKRLMLLAKVNWSPGMQVVISSPSTAWHYDGGGTILNDKACKQEGPYTPHCLRNIGFYVHGEGPPPSQDIVSLGGVEVCQIANVADDGMSLTLTEALIFPHRTQATSFIDLNGRHINVDTYSHIGLITRSIIIEGIVTGHASGAPPFEEHSAMPFGRFNKTPFDELTSEAITCAPVPETKNWKGPGGSIRCEQTCPDPSSGDCGTPDGSWARTQGSVYLGSLRKPVWQVYNDSMVNVEGCNSPPPTPQATPWYGQDSSACSGLDCVIGGSVKIMYAASARLDGVELLRMGIPGNAGTLGQYSVHFHLAGWGSCFKSYTESPRELVFVNNTNWRSFSRWVVLHGTNYATVRNNVFVLCAGHGIFLEDGVEQSNIIEHNYCLLAMPTGTQKWIEQGAPLGGIIGNAGFDVQQVASIWLTNQNNYVCRNIVACNPGSSMGIWSICESTHSKSGPANLCTGDPQYKLPGFVGGTLYKATSEGGQFRPISYVPDDSVLDTSVLTPNKDGYLLAHKKQFGEPNNLVMFSYRLMAENVCYNCAMFIMEHTDNNPAAWFPNSGTSNYNLYDASSMYIPINADTGGSLLIHAWGNVYSGCGVWNDDHSAWRRSIRVWSQNLSFDMGGRNTQATGGYTWVQDGGLMLIGECILGADRTSNSANAKIDAKNNFDMWSFGAILCDSVINGSIPGGGIDGGTSPSWKNNCAGILLYGDCVVGKDSCFGAEHPSTIPKPPPFTISTPTGCNAIQDANPPAFVLIAGYTNNVFPLGSADAMVDFIKPFAANGYILGLSSDDQNSCVAPGNTKKAIVFDFHTKSKWVYDSTSNGTITKVPWKLPPSSPDCQLPERNINGEDPYNPVGCTSCNPVSYVLKSTVPLQTAPGQKLMQFLCANVSYFPGYTPVP